jgi:hypothetical protein
MATDSALQILASGTMAEVGNLSVEEREAFLKKPFRKNRQRILRGFWALISNVGARTLR